MDFANPFCYCPASRLGFVRLRGARCRNPIYFAGLASGAGPNDHELEGTHRLQVLVRDNNVDQALKALKKKMQREGIFREMKLRGHYEKPSEKKAREKAEAIRRARKLARKRAQREGLLPGKPKPVMGGPGGRPGGPGGPGGPRQGGGGFGGGGGGGGGGFSRGPR
jgi:small subunit ribosomal protein S21